MFRRFASWIDANAQLWNTLEWSTIRAAREFGGVFFAHAPQKAQFVSVILELIHRAVPGIVPEPVGAMLAQSVVLRNYLEKGEKGGLLFRHAQDRWPEWDVTAAATRCNVPSFVIDSVFLQPDVGYRDGVLNAPALAAAISTLDINADSEIRFHLRRLRAFDPSWFDIAHATALTSILVRMLDNNPEHFNAN